MIQYKCPRCFFQASLFSQCLEGKNGVGGNPIKKLGSVALRSNHIFKSFWFWSSSNTFPPRQFSPAQARFLCPSWRWQVFPFKNPGRELHNPPAYAAARGLCASAVSTAAPLLEGMLDPFWALMDWLDWHHLFPAAAGPEEKQPRGGTQCWVCSARWQTLGKSRRGWDIEEMWVGRSRRIQRKRPFRQRNVRECLFFSLEGTFNGKRNEEKLPRPDWSTEVPAASW